MSCYLSTCTTQINTVRNPATRCPICNNLTCLKHRLAHSCPGAPKAESKAADKKASAMAKFSEWRQANAAKTKVGESLSSFLKPRPSATAAATIARAKAIASLKAAAKGDAAVAAADRVYLFVESDLAPSKTAKAEMFFGKDYPMGKVLDKAAARLQVPNRNSSKTADTDRLRVFHVESGRVLEYSVKLGASAVKDGDTIVLVKGIVMPSLLH